MYKIYYIYNYLNFYICIYKLNYVYDYQSGLFLKFINSSQTYKIIFK